MTTTITNSNQTTIERKRFTVCGIFGFSELNERTRLMAPLLAWAMESRGADSWGATDGTAIIKHLGPITNSWELPAWERGIFHTRAASVGSKSVENAHPFGFAHNGRSVIGIHNGHISNHQALNARYKRNFEVDSMHVFAHMAEGLPTTDIEGWGALAWYENGLPCVARFNADALHVAKLESKEIVFASTALAVHKAARMAGTSVKFFWQLRPEVKYYWRQTNGEFGWQLFEGERLPFGYRNHASEYVHCGAGRVDSASSVINVADDDGFPNDTESDRLCFKCQRKPLDRKRAILCQDCMESVLRGWDRMVETARLAESRGTLGV